MTIEYRPEDFTPNGIITKYVIQHVLTTVQDFEPRYYHALGDIDLLRCDLDYADGDLWDDIVEAALDCFDFDEWSDIPECFFDGLASVFG